MAKELRKSEQCSNCGHILSDDSYCASCGQQNTDNSVSIWLLIKDFIDDYFSFDSRLFKSIAPLLFKPGFLTSEFNAGKRVKYSPPLRMYFIISLIFFLVPTAEDPKEKEILSIESVSVSTKKDKDVAKESEKTEDHSNIDIKTGNKGVNFNLSDLDTNRLSEKRYVDSIANNIVDSAGLERNSFWGKVVFRGVDRVLRLYDDGGKKFKSDLKDNIPTMMFFLLPVFALFIRLFHYRRKPLYVHCVIFSLHYHAFVFLVLLFFNLVALAFFTDDLFDWLSVLFICVYLVVAMKKVFEQSYGRAIMKFFGLSMLYIFTLSLSFVVTVLTTLLY